MFSLNVRKVRKNMIPEKYCVETSTRDQEKVLGKGIERERKRDGGDGDGEGEGEGKRGRNGKLSTVSQEDYVLVFSSIAG